MKLKATLAALATMGLLAVIFALPALAGHVDGGVDEAWTNDMNQESYWEARFGAECTKFENHSGSIPAGYTQVVVKDGNYVRIYDPAPSPFTAVGPVNPANGKHFEPPHSWVMKCRTHRETTTTTSSTSTSTTSTSLATTTTSTPSTSTTTPDTTTTIQATSTSSSSDTSTTSPGATTTTAQPSDALPFTGLPGSGLLILGGALLVAGGVGLVRSSRD